MEPPLMMQGPLTAILLQEVATSWNFPGVHDWQCCCSPRKLQWSRHECL